MAIASDSGRIVVVGAGVSGLVAARELEAAGARVCVVEAEPEVGGALRAQALDGVPFETALQVAPGLAPELGALLAELGLGRRVTRTPLRRAALWTPRRREVVPLDLRSALGPHPLRGWRLRRWRVLRRWLPSLQSAEALVERLDDRSIADAARVYLGRRALDRLLAPVCELAFGVPAEDSSRALLWQIADGAGEPRLALLSGARALPAALASGLAEVRTGARAVHVLPEGRGVRLANGEDVRGDACVLAVPIAELAKLLPDLPPAASRSVSETRRQPALAVVTLVPPGLRGPARCGLFPASAGGAVSGLLDLTPSGVDTTLLWLALRPEVARKHGHVADDTLIRLALESAARLHPGLLEADAPARLIRAPGGVPMFQPGALRSAARLRTSLASYAGGRVVPAGRDLCGPDLDAAIRAGRHAARALTSLS